MINVQCESEGCGQDFGISFSDVDEYKQAGKRFLCPECEAKVAEAEVVEEPKRRFEYMTTILDLLIPADAVPDSMLRERLSRIERLNKLGHDGWELLAITDKSVAILKREYFE